MPSGIGAVEEGKVQFVRNIRYFICGAWKGCLIQLDGQSLTEITTRSKNLKKSELNAKQGQSEVAYLKQVLF